MCTNLTPRAFRRSAAGLSTAMLIVVGLGGPAVAEGLDITNQMRAELRDRIDVTLTGKIDARCLLSGGGGIDLGELRGGESVAATFGLDCNVPFDIDIQSTRGGLAHVTTPQGEGPFSGLLEYDLRLSVPTLRPNPDLIEGRYSSRELLSERRLSSGDAIGAGGGTIEFQMKRPSGEGLLAGKYSETLSLTITPRM